MESPSIRTDRIPKATVAANGSIIPLCVKTNTESKAQINKMVKSRKLQSQRFATARKFCGYIYFFITPPLINGTQILLD